MKTNNSKVLLVIFFTLLFSMVSFPQTVGKIFSQAEANNLFGSVIESTPISLCDLISVLNQTQNYIMFQINNKELIILGDGRKVLFPVGKNVDPNEIFALYSISIVKELLDQGSETTIVVEKRKDTLTVTFGLNTLEFSSWCPPICP